MLVAQVVIDRLLCCIKSSAAPSILHASRTGASIVASTSSLRPLCSPCLLVDDGNNCALDQRTCPSKHRSESLNICHFRTNQNPVTTQLQSPLPVPLLYCLPLKQTAVDFSSYCQSLALNHPPVVSYIIISSAPPPYLISCPA